jgi:hypothetical protein
MALSGSDMKGFSMAEQKREYFRVEFPRDYHPNLTMSADTYEIEDVSEFGLKFKVETTHPFTLDELVMATIVFPDGEEYELSGQIVRIDHSSVSMLLETPVPLNKIRAEHLHLIQHYNL